MERSLSGLGVLFFILAIIGALNWGLIGIFNFNLVDAIFGGGSVEETSVISRVVYAIVGLCGLASCFYLPRFYSLSRHEPARMAGTARA